MILDHSPKEISLFFLYSPTVFCSLWSYGGGRCLCLCNRQSVSMRLENIFLNSQGASLALHGCCHAPGPAPYFVETLEMGPRALSFLSVAHLALAAGAVLGVSGWLWKSHDSSFSVPSHLDSRLADPHVTVYIRHPSQLLAACLCCRVLFYKKERNNFLLFFFIIYYL